MCSYSADHQSRPKDVEALQQGHQLEHIYHCDVPEAGRPRALLVIPHSWLLPNFSVDAVRSLQPKETSVELDRGDLRLEGVEVVVARNWVKDEYWPRMQEALQAGYPAETTYTFMRVHGDRRRTQRESG